MDEYMQLCNVLHLEGVHVLAIVWKLVRIMPSIMMIMIIMMINRIVLNELHGVGVGGSSYQQ